MRIAAKVRLEKEAHPERFCRVKSCLWRVVTSRGPNPCQTHPVDDRPDIALDDFSAKLTAEDIYTRETLE